MLNSVTQFKKSDDYKQTATAVAEPEPRMAVPDVPANGTEQNITVPLNFFTQLVATLQQGFKQIAEDIRKPPIDPVKEAQAKRAKETKEFSEKQTWELLRSRALTCNHVRSDMTSAVAWAEQSDTYGNYPDLCEQLGITNSPAMMNHIVRGACQHCQTLFSPRREECVSEEVFKMYREMRRIPVDKAAGGVMYLNS